MRKIEYIVIHCTATSQLAKVENILKYWKETLGWINPGYHYIIEPDGRYRQLQAIELIANGVKGFNKTSIHIAYIGGVNEHGRAIDNRTQAQRMTMRNLVMNLKMKFPQAQIKGHRDFPGVLKDCPSFNASTVLDFHS